MVAEDTAEIDTLVEIIKMCSRTAMLVPLEAARALQDQLQTEEALLPLLDPTLWMKTHQQIEWHGPYLAAFVRYRAELEKLAEGSR